MAVSRALFSSASCEWPTPEGFFKVLDQEFGFTLDVCASESNAKAGEWFGEKENGLCQFWHGVVWMNPLYGRGIGEWVKKAYESAVFGGATVVCLLPARTDTRWFHDYCLKGEVRFVKGRLKFGDATENAPFPSMVVVFRGGEAC